MKATATKTAKTASPAADRKPYPKYKDIGSDWVSRIPEHWEIKRLKDIAFINGETLPETTPRNFEILYVDISNVDEQGNILVVENYPFEDAPSRARRVVRDGDTIISTVRTYLRAISRIEDPDPNLVVSTGFAVLRPTDKVLPGYLYALVQSEPFVQDVVAHSDGVGYPAISPTVLGGLKVVLPPLDEQQAISEFVHVATSKIDGLISKKQKLLLVLEEKRTALISGAVTRGLNPNATMKASGVEWLGDIPEKWDVSKLGAVATVKARLGWKGLKASEYRDSGVIFLSTPNIKFEAIDFESVDYISKERYDESPEIQLAVGDVLIAKDGSTLGITNVVRHLPSPTTVNSSIAVVRPRERMDPVFLNYFFKSNFMQNVIQRMKDGMGVPHLFQADLRKFIVLVPPINEQSLIAQHLDEKVAGLHDMIHQNQRVLAALREYRAAIITSAVTGQFDARQSVSQSKSRVANPYFIRSVLAAEIVHQLHREPTFGHVKLQKLFFLVEHEVEATDFDTHYTRQAAGPLDRKLLFSIDRQLQQQKWYKPIQSQGRHLYVPMEHAGNHRKYYETHWSHHDATIQRIISLFRVFDTERCEIVATLYAAWNDILLSGQSPTDDQIVDEVVNHWHEKKQRIEKNRWSKALQWMRDNDLVPKGIGTATQRI